MAGHSTNMKVIRYSRGVFCSRRETKAKRNETKAKTFYFYPIADDEEENRQKSPINGRNKNATASVCVLHSTYLVKEGEFDHIREAPHLSMLVNVLHGENALVVVGQVDLGLDP